MIFYKPYLGIAFVIVSIPFEGRIISDCTSIFPIEIILAILVLVCVYKNIVGRCNCFGNTKLVFFYLPFVFCLVFSSLKTMELSLTIKEIVRWLELIVIYFLTINLINEKKKLRVILYTMALAVVVVSISGSVSYLSGAEISTAGRPGVQSFFSNTNSVAGYVNLIIPVLFGMLVTSEFLWERIALGVSIVLSFMAWFMTFSRTGWLSLIVTMILLCFLTKVKKRVFFLLTIFTITFTVSVLSLGNKYDFLARFKLQPTLSTLEHRAMFFKVGFNLVKDNMISGIGIGNYHLLVKEFTNENAYHLLIKKFFKECTVSFYGEFASLLSATNLHNLYLQVFVETGLMGLIAFVFWLVCIASYLVSSLNTLVKIRNYWLFVGLVGGVVVYLINNLADVLVVHGIHLQWGIILGLAVVLTQLRESETCSKTV
ncbi:MAG: O-antigen ligase family protein [Candidatus Scalindua sp.]|nr:O-antigen ligase family protein [Candidatus Scalindua sp.]